MSDTISKEARSRVMGRVKGQNTKPEMQVRSLLHRLGYRFRLHRKELPGTPDIVLPKRKTAIFVHGCFWHQHQGCRRSKRPSSNTDYWHKKLERNVMRDIKNVQLLEEAGWKTITIWECELKNVEALTEKLKQKLV